MKKELRDLIAKYQAAVSELFPLVARHLGASIPITNLEWFLLKVEQVGETQEGVRYFRHGYGVEMSFGDRSVDFDIGKYGEIDGFDAWRLFEFAQASKIVTPYKDGTELEKDLKQAEGNGEVRFSGDILYYLNDDASTIRPVKDEGGN